MKQLPTRITIIALLTIIASACLYLSLQLHNNSIKDKDFKTDYFIVNQIKYGMLSGDNWSRQVNKIIELQIDAFTFDNDNKKLITGQIDDVLNRLFDEVDAVLHKKQNNFKDKIKFGVINTFVDIDKFRKEIPRFSHSIVEEIDKSKNKDELKHLLKDKITGILNAADQDIVGEQQQVLSKYIPGDIAAFNRFIAAETGAIQKEQTMLAYSLIALLVLTLFLWIFIIKTKELQTFSFLFSVVISLIVLFIGVSLPMIEIDARISTFDLKLLSSHIVFNDQVIFFQTKSILDVIHILVTDGKGDTVFVGCLIFLFSVLFPVMKLISASIYLFIRERSNRFVKYMAFKSGKWSMADVMVVAIFMAYIGFQGILNNQLGGINMSEDAINVITTNKSGLQSGFVIFVAFVLFNLMLAEILKRITKEPKNLDDNSILK